MPKGFSANGIACGIKKTGKLDLALFYSGLTAKASCMFTTNSIQAAPIQVDKRYLRSNKGFRAIIVNSGNANAFLGKEGLGSAQEMTKVTAGELRVMKENILVASTGVIGKSFPIIKIKGAVPELVQGLSCQGIDRAKRAIMTTDKFAKEFTAVFNIGKSKITVCGIAKGAGMIAPNMATMLVFIFTDANITQGALDRALKMAVDNSFNCITVDGCMSTNDTVALMANHAAENKMIDTHSHFALFFQALDAVCLELAKMIVRDGEGATKFIRIKVEGAKDYGEAKKIALNIANSNLFKTAMFASSANVLGRIAAAAGASGIDIKEKDLKIKFTPLAEKEVDISVFVGKGNSSAVIYTSDLTHEYVKINAEYN